MYEITAYNYTKNDGYTFIVGHYINNDYDEIRGLMEAQGFKNYLFVLTEG